MPRRPTATPIAAPPTSSQTTSPTIGSGPVPCAPCWLSRVTASTDGGSFRPDSPSSIPDSVGGSGSLRSTEKTAAASVGARTAPSSSASRQPRPSSQCVHAATTPMLTTTPTVARAIAAGAARLACSQLVVRPPSARISTSAPRPSVSARSALSNLMPRPLSPSARPSPRKTSRAGRPTLCASRAATMAARTVASPDQQVESEGARCHTASIRAGPEFLAAAHAGRPPGDRRRR